MAKDRKLYHSEISLENDSKYQAEMQKLTALQDRLRQIESDHAALAERRRKQMAMAGQSSVVFVGGVDETISELEKDEPDLGEQLKASRRKIQRFESAVQQQEGTVMLARDEASRKICEQFQDENLRLVREMLGAKIKFQHAVEAVASFRASLESKGIQTGLLAQGNVRLDQNRWRPAAEYRNFLQWYLDRGIISEKERNDIMLGKELTP